MEKKMVSMTVEELMFLDWIRNMDSEERVELKNYMKERLETETYRTCPMCMRKAHITVDPARLKKFQNKAGLIQEIFPDLDAYERKFILSGYCPECQEILFGADPYEGDKIIYD